MREEKDKFKDLSIALSFLSFVSSTFIGCLAMGYFTGQWLDEKFSFAPRATIAGLFGGATLAVWAVVSRIKASFLPKHKDKK
jgi:F0F1-type ATP synthase assembly protein I